MRVTAAPARHVLEFTHGVIAGARDLSLGAAMSGEKGEGGLVRTFINLTTRHLRFHSAVVEAGNGFDIDVQKI